MQRCAEDMAILITTYEGTHNHPLPISATAMASTTSAAASMLLSGSSSSHPGPGPTADPYGLNFALFADTISKPRQNQQIYINANPPISSSTPSHPTITLDLTSTPRYSINATPPTSLNFTAPSSNPCPNPDSWFGQPYNKRPILNNVPQENAYHSFFQKLNSSGNNNNSTSGNNNYSGSSGMGASIAAATKAITSDPSFQSALAAALTSVIGGQGGGGYDSRQGVGGSGAGSLTFLPPSSFPFSSSKSAQSSSPDNTEHTS